MPIRVYVLVGHANFNSISLGTYPYSYCCSYRTFAIPIRSLLHANTIHGSMPTQVQNYGCGMVYIWNHCNDIVSPYPSEINLMLLWGKKICNGLMDGAYRSKTHSSFLRNNTI